MVDASNYVYILLAIVFVSNQVELAEMKIYTQSSGK